MNIFSQLTKEEMDQLQGASALITILVGGSDGKLDGEERNWSEKLLRARAFSAPKELQDFYLEVAEGLWVELQHQLNALPQDTAQRNAEISRRLESLNGIFSKLSPEIAYRLYKGFLGLASEVAKASGGFLRMGAVSAAEYPWVKLPMVQPIPAPSGLTEADQSRFDENIWGEKISE